MRVRRVFGLFWLALNSIVGGNIDNSIWPPTFEVENRRKRTEKSTEHPLIAEAPSEARAVHRQRRCLSLLYSARWC